MRILKTFIIWICSTVLVNKCITQAVPTLTFSRNIFSATPNIVMFICEVSNNAPVTIEVYRANDASRSDQLAMEVDIFSVEYTAVLSPSNELFVICIDGDDISDPVYFAAIPLPLTMNPELEVYISRDNLFSLQCPYQLGIASNFISPYHYVWFDSNGIETVNETNQTFKGKVSAGDLSSTTRYSCALRIKDCSSSDCNAHIYPTPSLRPMFKIIAIASSLSSNESALCGANPVTAFTCMLPGNIVEWTVNSPVLTEQSGDVEILHLTEDKPLVNYTTNLIDIEAALTAVNISDGQTRSILALDISHFHTITSNISVTCTVTSSTSIFNQTLTLPVVYSILNLENITWSVETRSPLAYRVTVTWNHFSQPLVLYAYTYQVSFLSPTDAPTLSMGNFLNPDDNITCSSRGVWNNTPELITCDLQAVQITISTTIGVIVAFLLLFLIALCCVSLYVYKKCQRRKNAQFATTYISHELTSRYNTQDIYSSVEGPSNFKGERTPNMGPISKNNDGTVEGVSSAIVNAWSVILDEIMKFPDLPDALRIPKSQLKLNYQPIGQGETGMVYKGVLTEWKGLSTQTIAVKTLKGFFSSNDVQFLLKEVIKMKDFDHPHVLPLIGVCLDAGPGVSMTLTVQKLLLRTCYQIALGMQYLSKQKVIHRDLAARNCMLDSSCNIKVGDFGLSEDVYSTGYFRQTDRENVRLPFKWMALESLNDAIFTEKTDVWSYGVTMWEIFSGGQIPYPGVDVWSLVKILDRGERLDTPTNAACSAEIFAVMQRCWSGDSEERPTFTELSSIMETLLSSVADYTELSMALPHLQQNLTDKNGYAEILDTTLGVTDQEYET